MRSAVKLRFFCFLIILIFYSHLYGQNLSSSVLVLSFSNISVDEFSDLSSEVPHLEQFVNESVRFTHVYTPSVNDAAALTSLLTGLYPAETGVHNNGASNLNDGILSLSELLGQNGRSSYFASGGPPILRKSALSRGFNDFDDQTRVGGSFYIKSKDLAAKAWPNIEQVLSRDHNLAILYFADLLLMEKPSKEKKLQALDEAVEYLRSRLVKAKLWDSLTVVLVGLHGSGRIESLYDDQIRIPLVIKPARKKRDLSPTWKVDSFLSLPDLGVTLSKILGVEFKKSSALETLDISPALEGQNFAPPLTRTLVSESDILSIQGWGPRFFAIRSAEWVFFPVEKKLFNTYTDRLQINNLYGKDTTDLKVMEDLWKQVVSQIPISFISMDIYPDIFEIIKSGTGAGFNLENKKSKVEQIALLECLNFTKKIRQKVASDKFEKICRDKETVHWVKAYSYFKQGRVKEASAFYDVAKVLTERRFEQKEVQILFWRSLAQMDWPAQKLTSEVTFFERFLALMESTEFSEFVKKKPAL